MQVASGALHCNVDFSQPGLRTLTSNTTLPCCKKKTFLLYRVVVLEEPGRVSRMLTVMVLHGQR